MCKRELFEYLCNGKKAGVESELFFGMTYMIGSEDKVEQVENELEHILQSIDYKVHQISIKELILQTEAYRSTDNEHCQYKRLMDAAKQLCSGGSIDSARLAQKAVSQIVHKRESEGHPRGRNAYIINAIKRPEELKLLRRVYGDAFFLIGIYKPTPERKTYMARVIEHEHLCDCKDNIENLIKQDAGDGGSGTKAKKVYHQSDLFIDGSRNSSSPDTIRNELEHFVKLIFGAPNISPTFHEHAMFMAYCNAMHSADLSRQVGAVICKGEQIVGLGANECTHAGGGQYYTLKTDACSYEDVAGGKDHTRNESANRSVINEIIENVVKLGIEKGYINNENREAFSQDLHQSNISDITEFGRMIHAEMEAIMSCTRKGIATEGTTLYCTTFPCHNCAKHIIDAGIKEVYFIEPYQKSRALELFNDSMVYFYEDHENKVVLRPYFGVSARRYIDFFSLNLGRGDDLDRTYTDEQKKVQIRDNLLSVNSKPRKIVPIDLYMSIEHLVTID